MNDPAVMAVPVVDGGEPLVDTAGRIRSRDDRGLADGRYRFVRSGVLDRLGQVESSLPPGLHLLLIEGHRRSEVQREVMTATAAAIGRRHPEWDPVTHAAAVARYVAPEVTAGHVAGAAVDLTLCDDTGLELDLGSPEGVGEDDSDGACWFAAAVPAPARTYRDALAAAMTAAGFVNYPSEWWHWSYGDRYWAAVTGAPTAMYGAATRAFDHPADAVALAAASRCDNTGRWGTADRLGTLNYITPDVRTAAAREVREGVTVSLARPIDTAPSAVNPRPAWHVMHLETERLYATADSVHLQIHGLATTHLDALGHMFLDGVGYNGVRQDETVTMTGLRELRIDDLADGVMTRGVLLDVAAAAGVPWLMPGATVDAELLDRAEAGSGTLVRPGDAVFVHVGLEARERAQGPEDPRVRAGLDVSAVEWLHRREVAVYSGDCIERFPETGTAVPMPLHQIGIARMGLTLLDCPRLAALVEQARALSRATFMVVLAPLVIRGGTGSPVNPIAVF